MNAAINMDTATAALLASSLAALVATLGLVVVVFRAGFAERFSPYLASIAAGLLVATAIFLFPEAIESVNNAPVYVLFGYFILFTLNRTFNASTTSENVPGSAIPPLLAIGLHSLIDGVEYGVLFSFDIYSAIIASFGLILHEFAEGVVLYVLLRHAGLGKATAFLLAFMGAALTTPLGTLLANYLIVGLDNTAFGIVTSMAVGALLYVGTTHLIDHLKDAPNRGISMLLYLVGMLLAGVLGLLHHHGDGHDHHHDHHDHAYELQEEEQDDFSLS